MYKKWTLLPVLMFLIFSCLGSVSPHAADFTWYEEICGYTIDTVKPSMAVDAEDNLWLCAMDRVFRFYDGRWFDETDRSGPGTYVTATQDSSVWVAYDGCLARYNNGTWKHYYEEDGLPKDSVRAISALNGSVVWIAYHVYDDREYGSCYLVRFDGETFVTYREGFLQERISRLAATDDGGVWIAYNSFYGAIDCFAEACPKGFSFFDGTDFTNFTHEDIIHSYEYPIDISHVPWICRTPDDIVYVICNGTLVKYENGSWAELFRDNRGIMSCGPDGSVWIGHIGWFYGYHLKKYQNNILTEYDLEDISSYMYAKYEKPECPLSYALAVTSDGIVWVGSSRGVMRMDTASLPFRTETSVAAEKPFPAAAEVVSSPNPFNISTTITCTIAKAGYVRLAVYDVTGSKAATLIDGFLQAGKHTVQFDGTEFASGVYFYCLDTGGMRKAGKMLLVK